MINQKNTRIFATILVFFVFIMLTYPSQDSNALVTNETRSDSISLSDQVSTFRILPTPTVSITSPTNTQLITTSTVLVTGTAADTGSGIQKVEVSVDGGTYSIATGTTSWTFTTPALSNGVHTINAKATDNAGNTVITTIPFTTGQSASLVIGQTGFTSGGLGTTASTFASPRGLSFDSSGNMWVVDQSNHRILEYLKGSGFTTGQSASLVIGQSNFTSGSSGTTASTLNFPRGLSFDSSGNMWVVDFSNNRILKFTAPFSTGQSASLVIGQSNFTSGSSGTTASTLQNPIGLTFDSSGNLWVVEQNNNRILKFTAPFSTGQSASLVVGQTDFTSFSPGTTASNISAPQGLAFDSSGNLWVADAGNNRILKFTAPFSTGQSASLVIGQTDFTSFSSGTTANNINFPTGLTFDSSGNLWIVDFHNHRLLKFTAPFSTGQSASLVIGQTDFTSSGFGTTADTLTGPRGLTFDFSGNLWVADANNNRVLEYTTSITVATLPSVSLSDSISIDDQLSTDSATRVAQAMGLSNTEISQADLGTSDPTGVKIETTPVLGFPTEGNSFVILSNGCAGDAISPNTEPGHTCVLNGLKTSQGNDMTQLKLVLNVPAGATHIAFDWRFLSEEFPDFVGSPFNDGFLVEMFPGTASSTFTLSNSTITAPDNIVFDQFGHLISVNTQGPLSMNTDNAAGTIYGGSTPTLQTLAPLPTGATTITLIFSIFDMGDSVFDTSVFIDNLRFETIGSTHSVTVGHTTLPLGGSYSINSNTPILDVTSSNIPSSITVPSNTNAAFDFSGIEFGINPITVSLTPSSTITSTIGGLHYVLGLPQNLVITGPSSWDGRFNLPQSASTSAPPPLAPGLTSIVSATVEVGGGNTRLTFNHAIRILIPNGAGKDVFFSQSGSTTTFSTLCNSDTQADADSQLSLGGTEECQTNVGVDKVIWTKHASTFGTFVSVSTPTITSATAGDPNSPPVSGFSTGDTITIRFDQATNRPLGINTLNKTSVDSIFTFSPTLGTATYSGQWVNPATFVITIISPGTGNPQIGTTTVSVNSGANLKNAAGTSSSTTSASTLVGDFGAFPAPFITALIADGSNGGDNTVFSQGDNFTIRFNTLTNTPGGTGVQDKIHVDNIFTFSPTLGTATYSGQWVNPATFVITIISPGAGNPQIGTTTVSVNSSPTMHLKNAAGTSVDSTSTSPPLSGNLGTFIASIPVASGGTASTTLPSGITASITLPQTAAADTVTIVQTTADTAGPSGSVFGFVGKVVDITPTSTDSCALGCDISFTVSTSDVQAAGLSNVNDVKILHDHNGDGLFTLPDETLNTVVTPTSDPSVFIISAHDSFNSKFAIGGVVSVLALLGSGAVSEPPEFSGAAFDSNEYPLTIDNNQYKLENHTNKVSTVTLKTGTQSSWKILAFENSGAQFMEHMAIYATLHSNDPEISNSNIGVIYDKGQPLQIQNLYGILKSATVTTHEVNKKLEFDFDLTFAKSLPKSDLIIRAWDDRKYTTDVNILNAIEVTGNDIVSAPSSQRQNYTVTSGIPVQTIISNTAKINLLTGTPNTSVIQIPAWIKNNADWWSSGKIGDSDFEKGMQYLVEQKIVQIPTAQSSTSSSETNIPSWIKNNAKWWSHGDISDNEFVKGIQYLITSKIITISHN